jgi:hypothetical protein
MPGFEKPLQGAFMKRIKKIMVLDFSVPEDDRDAKSLFEYFDIQGTPEEFDERMRETAADFLKSDETDDVATWFLKMYEEGRITSSEVLLFAVQAWSGPLFAAQDRVRKIMELFNSES